MSLIDVNGRPLAVAPRPRARAGHGVYDVPAYRAADTSSQDLATWTTRLGSPDADLLPERDTMVSRARDLARNNAYGRGAVRQEVDSVVGAALRLSYRPDWRALGLTAEWAADFSRRVEGLWRLWAADPRRLSDAERQLSVPQLFAQAYRHYCVDGDAIATLLWRPERGGMWGTALRVVHPDLLSNPHHRPDEPYLRGGVEIDGDGAAVAYHFRLAHDDLGMLGAVRAYEWERVPREMPWGRPVVVHHFDKEQAGQHRGESRFVAVVKRLRMAERYEETELQAAVLNAILAAFIESPFDHELLAEGLDDGKLSGYQAERASFHQQRNLTLGGVRIPTLFPGEKLTFQTAQRPAAQFAAFEAAVLRNVAAGIGMSYEQLTRDWSQVNYSSARASLLEVWRGWTARREAFTQGFCTPVFGAWLEETIERGLVEMPAEAPDFRTAQAAWVRCKWLGPGRGWVDPTKEAQAAQMRMDAGLSTLEAECAEQGLDWEEVLEQRRLELDRLDALGLPRPRWADARALDAASGGGEGGSDDDRRRE